MTLRYTSSVCDSAAQKTVELRQVQHTSSMSQLWYHTKYQPSSQYSRCWRFLRASFSIEGWTCSWR